MPRHARMVLLPALIVLLSGGSAFGQLYVWQPVTPESVIRAVREFEGDPTLPVTVTEFRSFKDRPSESECTLTAGYHLYTVRPHQFTMHEEPHSRSASGAHTPTRRNPISDAQAERIARRALEVHFPHPGVLSLARKSLAIGPWNSQPMTPHYWFEQQPAPDVSGPSSCGVTVDPVYGEVAVYKATDLPLLVSPKPYLSPDQAAASAAAILRMKDPVLREVCPLRVTQPDEFGLQRLVYTFIIEGTGPFDARFWAKHQGWGPATPEDLGGPRRLVGPKQKAAHRVDVDAHDGSVWGVTGVDSPSLPINRPVTPAAVDSYAIPDILWDGKPVFMRVRPVLIAGELFMDARYLCYGDARARLVKQGKGVYAVKGGKHRITFRLDSPDYSFDGRKRKLSTEPTMLNGVPHVPLEALRDVLPFGVGYDPTRRAVWFGTPPPRDPVATLRHTWPVLVILLVVVIVLAIILLRRRPAPKTDA